MQHGLLPLYEDLAFLHVKRLLFRHFVFLHHFYPLIGLFQLALQFRYFMGKSKFLKRLTLSIFSLITGYTLSLFITDSKSCFNLLPETSPSQNSRLFCCNAFLSRLEPLRERTHKRNFGLYAEKRLIWNYLTYVSFKGWMWKNLRFHRIPFCICESWLLLSQFGRLGRPAFE